MKQFTVRTISFGRGMPLICVPVTEQEKEAVFNTAARIPEQGVKVCEFRADYLKEITHPECLRQILPKLRTILGECLLLFSYRSCREGGAQSETADAYEQIVRTAIETGEADLIDIERRSPAKDALIREAKEKGIRVIVSEHFFDRTPGHAEMVRSFRAMEQAGADIAKLACMPETKEDVERLIGVSMEMKEVLSVPHIAISMGDLGRMSRIEAEKIGSCMTFASCGEGSAPGQINVGEMRKLLLAFHEGLL